MSIRADAEDRYIDQSKVTFNAETGTFSRPLSAVDEDQDIDFDAHELQVDVADADIDFNVVDGSDAAAAAADVDVDADVDAADADSDQIFDPDDGENKEHEHDLVYKLLNDDEHFNKLVDEAAADVHADKQLAGGLNERAQQLVASRTSISGMIASGIANKIAERREARNYNSFSNNMDSLNTLTQRILPKNFNPNDPDSVASAKEWFKTDKGMADAQELSLAYKKLLDSGKKIVKDHRSGSSVDSSLGIQENILKKTASYIKQNEELLKTMKSAKSNEKSLHDDFKGGMGELMDFAKLLMSRLAVLLGMTKALRAEQSKPGNQAAAPKAPGMR